MTTCKPFTLVLDLDETLVHTMGFDQVKISNQLIQEPQNYHIRKYIYNLETQDVRSKNGTIKTYQFWGFVRPHVYEFLRWARSHFQNLVIWSAGEKNYVRTLVKHLFQGIKLPDLVLSRDDCVVIEGIHRKPLNKLIYKTKNFSHHHAIIVDDRPDYTIYDSEKSINIIPYQPYFKGTYQFNDNELLRVQKILTEIKPTPLTCHTDSELTQIRSQAISKY